MPQERQCKCMGECSSKTRTMSRLLGTPEQCQAWFINGTSEGQDGYCYQCYVTIREKNNEPLINHP